MQARGARLLRSSVLEQGEPTGLEVEDAKDVHRKALRLSKRGKLDQAVCLLKEGLVEFPDNVFLLTSCGVLLGRKGHYEDAADYFRQAVDADPANATALQV